MGKIHLENVCNIKSADIDIVDGKLNIKFGTNGTGKSSIVRAIKTASIKDEKTHEELLSLITPYDALEGQKPLIEQPYKNIKIFDPDYVDSFLFKEDELYKDSYKIVIDNSNTKAIREKIDNILNIEKYNNIINHFNNTKEQLNSNLGWNNENSKTGIIDGKKILAPFKKGNILNQYSGNTIYKESIKKKDFFYFVKYGKSLMIDNKCPYCLKEMSKDEIDDLNKVIEFFDKKNVEKFTKNKQFIEMNLYPYMDENSINETEDILDKKDDINNEDAHVLKKYFDEVQNEFNKLNIIQDIKKISLLDIKNIEIAKENISNAYLNSSLFKDEELKMCNEYNEYVKTVADSIDELYQLMIDLNLKLKSTIENNTNFVNSFLNNSGMNYQVDVDDEQKIVLRPRGLTTKKVQTPKNNLSFGERNSLSLMLFALEIQNSDADLIVLDDPISSFDINKKFAIFYQLFDKEDGIFRDKTVLMLTHEFSIVIDALKTDIFRDILPLTLTDEDEGKTFLKEEEVTDKETFNKEFPFTVFIRNNNGIIAESKITSKAIVCNESIDKHESKNLEKSRIVRACHIRRYIDMNYINWRGPYYLISSFLHCEPIPKYEKSNFFEQDKIAVAEENINTKLGIKEDKFNYYDWMNSITKKSIEEDFENAKSSLDKIFITRFYYQYLEKHPEECKNNAMHKSIYRYICSSYHIENEALMRLLEKYDTIPSHIIKACEEFFEFNK